MNCTVSWSLLATVYWLIEGMETDDQSFFAGDMPIRLLCPSFNKGRLHLVRDTVAEKDVDITK